MTATCISATAITV